MGKIDIEEHERMNRFIDGWREFGERLGWKLYRIDQRSGRDAIGHFERHDDQNREDGRISIGAEVRQDIEASWREQDKSGIKIEGNVIEGNVIKAASNA